MNRIEYFPRDFFDELLIIEVLLNNVCSDKVNVFDTTKDGIHYYHINADAVSMDYIINFLAMTFLDKEKFIYIYTDNDSFKSRIENYITNVEIGLGVLWG